MRIKTTSEGREGFDISSYYHVGCFSLPRKYNSGANKMSVEDFVKDVLEDESGEILLTKMEEVIAKIESTGSSPQKKSKHDDGDAEPSPLDNIKALYEKQQQDDESGKEPSKKKAKSDMSAMVEAYGKYKGYNVAQLKDILGYNLQNKVGTKDVLMFKVIDGDVHGRLAHCPLCTGKLKMDLSLTKVICDGRFDEDAQFRVPCENVMAIEKAKFQMRKACENVPTLSSFLGRLRYPGA